MDIKNEVQNTLRAMIAAEMAMVRMSESENQLTAVSAGLRGIASDLWRARASLIALSGVLLGEALTAEEMAFTLPVVTGPGSGGVEA